MKLNRIEQTGYLADTLLWHIAGNKAWKEEDLDIPWECAYELKESWEHGIHCGDCVRAASSCPVCHWNDILDTGMWVTMFLDQEKAYGIDERLRANFIGKEVDDEDATWDEFWSRFKKELVDLPYIPTYTKSA